MTASTQPVATLSANTGGTPQVAITNPAIAGPAARDTLTLTMSSRVAAANSERGTSSVIMACQVGDSMACPAPTANVNASSSAGGIMPKAVRTASRADTTMKYTWITNIIQRRSNASANTPAGSASNIIGSVLAVWTSGTMVAAFGSFTNSHWAPTICPHDPILAITTPSHSQKKARCRNGANGDADTPPVCC